jgi:hypothetical protein
MPVDDAQFESLLEQVRELTRRTDEITREQSRLQAHVRARLNWDRQPPPLPPEQMRIADEVVDVLTKRRLSSSQARLLHRTYFQR